MDLDTKSFVTKTKTIGPRSSFSSNYPFLKIVMNKNFSGDLYFSKSTLSTNTNIVYKVFCFFF